MNSFVFLLGLILIILSVSLILLNKRNGRSNIVEDNSFSDDNDIFSFHIENENEFEDILDNVNKNSGEKGTINQAKKASGFTNIYLNDKDLIMSNNFKNINVEKKEELKCDISEKIIELNDSGLSAEEIAKKLRRGIREIEIILKFQNKKTN